MKSRRKGLIKWILSKPLSARVDIWLTPSPIILMYLSFEPFSETFVVANVHTFFELTKILFNITPSNYKLIGI